MCGLIMEIGRKYMGNPMLGSLVNVGIHAFLKHFESQTGSRLASILLFLFAGYVYATITHRILLKSIRELLLYIVIFFVQSHNYILCQCLRPYTLVIKIKRLHFL